MLAQQIIAVLSFAMVAVASPLEIRTSSKTGPEAQQACGNGNTVKCCESTSTSTGGGILGNLLGGGLLSGNSCQDINVLSLLPIDQQCQTNTLCCQSGADTGNVNLINIENVCFTLL